MGLYNVFYKILGKQQTVKVEAKDGAEAQRKVKSSFVFLGARKDADKETAEALKRIKGNKSK